MSHILCRVFPNSNNKNKISDYSTNFKDSLLISDLDGFFKNIYEYYYNRGFSNIFTGLLLDNISYLFSIHFTIFNLYFIQWSKIFQLCISDNTCNLEVTDYITFVYLENYLNSFFLLYSLLISYYLVYFYKSLSFLYKMKKMKSVYIHKLHIKQKEMENMKFDDILERLIDLQKTENFCRVKENLTKFDVISRILRKENYCIAMISNTVLDLEIKIKIPFKKKEINLNLFSNYFYNNLSECILNFAFPPGDVCINSKFFNLRYLQFKMFIFMIFEIFFIPPVILFKIIFWIFKNAEGFSKTSRNVNTSFTQKLWSSYIQIIFRNYNELPHHFENRINSSYKPLNDFMNCFKDRMISILGKFVIIICGSFIFLVFIISTIDDRLLLELKFMGKKFVWLTFIVGLILSILGGASNNLRSNFEEDYIENIQIKEEFYKNFVNKIINVPFEFRQGQNFSSIFKIVSKNYELGVLSLFKEILSILTFPVLWIKIILKAPNIIKFFKSYSKSIEGIGTVYSYSIMDLNNFKILKEKDFSGITEATFNDRKFINSFISFVRNFKDDNSCLEDEYEVYTSTSSQISGIQDTFNINQSQIWNREALKNQNKDEGEKKSKSISSLLNFISKDDSLKQQNKNLEEKLFEIYTYEIGIRNYKNIDKNTLNQIRSKFNEFIFYFISQVI